MAYNNEAELQEFLRYIREDESYDEPFALDVR